MYKPKKSRILCKVILLMTLMLLMDGVVGKDNDESSVFNINIQASILSDALKQISVETGYSISLIGSYHPENSFSLHLDKISLDDAIKILLRGFNYYILHGERQRLIYLKGPTENNKVILPNIVQRISNNNGISNKVEAENTKRTSSGSIVEFIPEQKSNSDSFINKRLNMGSDGIVELIPDDNNNDESSEQRNYLYNYTNDNILEAIPVKTSTPDTIEEKVNLNTINIGSDGIPEKIKNNTSEQYKNWTAESKIGQDGILEVISSTYK